MKITLMTATENAKLKLAVDTDRPLTHAEWEALSAQMKAWEPAVMSEGTRIVNRLLTELQEADKEPDRVVNGLPVRNCPRRYKHAAHTWGEIRGEMVQYHAETPTENFWCMGDERH